MKIVAVFVVAGLLAVACGSDGDDATNEASDPTPEASATEVVDDTSEPSGTPEPSATSEQTPTPEETPTAVELTASYTGVTEDSITVGISMLDFEALVSSGLSAQGWGDQELVWRTFIDNLNANGGILGRELVPVFDKYNPVGMTEAEAACLRMTQDNEVFAVIGGFLGPASPATTCIVGDQETLLVGDGQNSERLALARAPWVQSGSNRERRLGVFLDLLQGEGMLDGISLAVVGGPEAVSEYESAPAALAERGVEPTVIAFTEATSGDIVAEDAAWEPIAERIRSEGADNVLLIGNSQGGLRGIRRAGLDVQTLVLDASGLTSPGATLAPEDLEGAITINGLSQAEAWNDPLIEECKEIFSAAHPEIELISPADIAAGEEQWYNPVIAYCTWLSLFAMIAEEAGADLTQETFAAAAVTFDQFALPGVPFASIGPDKFAASDSFRLSVFDPTVGERGSLVPLTDIIDATP